MKPSHVGWVTVTLSTTAPTPVAGTPPAPVTCRATSLWPGTGVVVATPIALRVSRIRTGDNGW